MTMTKATLKQELGAVRLTVHSVSQSGDEYAVRFGEAHDYAFSQPLYVDEALAHKLGRLVGKKVGLVLWELEP